MTTFPQGDETFRVLAATAAAYREKLADAIAGTAIEAPERHQTMLAAMRPHLERAREIQRQFRAAISPELVAEMKVAREAARQFQTVVKRMRIPSELLARARQMAEFSRHVEAFDSDRFNRRLDAAITNLAANGWVISVWETPLQLIVGASDLFKEGDPCGEEVLADHFRQIKEKVLGAVIDHFPLRGPILKCAFAAHDRGEYELSIPVLLAQADGIGSEMFGISPFTQQTQAVQAIAQQLQGLASLGEGTRSHWLLVTTLLPINASKARRAQFGSAMNRNTIMHGESIDYATEKNSLKAIAWLGYIASFKSELQFFKQASINSTNQIP